MMVAGASVKSEREVSSLVRKQLEIGNVWADKYDQDNLDGLTRAIRDSGELQPVFARAIVGLLSDKRLAMRTGAVAMLPEVLGEIDAAALIDLLQTRPELYYRKKPSRKYPMFYDDLAEAILVSIGRATEPGDARSIEFLREAAKGERAWVVVSSLASIDADWLCANATLVPRNTLGSVLLSLPTPEHREQLVRALAPWPESEREQVVAKRYWDTLKFDQAEIDKLKSIIAGAHWNPPTSQNG
jgi:hypothetical protein